MKKNIYEKFVGSIGKRKVGKYKEKKKKRSIEKLNERKIDVKGHRERRARVLRVRIDGGWPKRARCVRIRRRNVPGIPDL